MPPRDPKPAISRRKSKLKLDLPEPELAEMLHQYCDLRRRGFDQAAIKTKSSWPKSHQKLLLEEAQRRDMPGSQKSQPQAVTEWLLAMYDAGTELIVIQRTSALSNLQTKKRLEAALVLQSHLNRECLKASLVMGLQGSGLMPSSPP